MRKSIFKGTAYIDRAGNVVVYCCPTLLKQVRGFGDFFVKGKMILIKG